jgi:hypothetical protein
LLFEKEPLGSCIIHALNPSAFAVQCDKIEHHFEPVANHSTIKFFARKSGQVEIGGTMSNCSDIASQTQ